MLQGRDYFGQWTTSFFENNYHQQKIYALHSSGRSSALDTFSQVRVATLKWDQPTSTTSIHPKNLGYDK